MFRSLKALKALKALATVVPAVLLLGCGGAVDMSVVGAGAVYKVTPAASGISTTVAATGNFNSPLDNVPSSDGATFYFVASTLDGKPAVYSVAASGATAVVLVSGAPLVSPLGISISSDDKILYVADPTAGVFMMPVGGGTPVLLAGTNCLKPRALDVAKDATGDTLYIATGAGACGGGAGLAKMAAAGGAVTFVAMGAPFTVPSGVAVATNGDVYVSNPGSDAAATGNILKVTGGAAAEFVPGLSFGYPAGIALDLTNTLLFASGHDATGHDQVYAITLANKMTATFNTGISQNTTGGGLHRARAADVLSWADVKAKPVKP